MNPHIDIRAGRLRWLWLSLLPVLFLGQTGQPGVCAAETHSGDYFYLIDNIKTVEPDATANIWVALPLQRDCQKITVEGFDPAPVEIITESAQGNRIVHWQVRPTPGTRYVILQYSFTAELSARLNEIPPGASFSPPSADEAQRRFTGPEFGIETDGEILALAREIVGDITDPYRQAEAFFSWIVGNLEFVPGGTGHWSARLTGLNRRGDCKQYSLLFTALCRSHGIPARTLTCQWLTGGRHVLAEFFLPEWGWIPVDPSTAQVLKPGSTALTPAEVTRFVHSRGIPVEDPQWLFGNLYRNRLLISVGNNIEVAASATAEARVFTTLEPGGRDASPPACELTGFNPDVVHGGFFHFGPDDLDPDAVLALAHQRLAHAYFDAGLYAEAEEGCLGTLQTGTEEVTAWLNLGRVYLRKGEYGKAEASFHRARTATTSSPGQKLESLIWTHNMLGNCYDLLGRRKLARTEYQKVIQIGNDYRGAVQYARKYLNNPFAAEDL